MFKESYHPLVKQSVTDSERISAYFKIYSHTKYTISITEFKSVPSYSQNSLLNSKQTGLKADVFFLSFSSENMDRSRDPNHNEGPLF